MIDAFGRYEHSGRYSQAELEDAADEMSELEADESEDLAA